MRKRLGIGSLVAVVVAAGLVTVGCGGGGAGGAPHVVAEGSRTVGGLTSEAAEQFRHEHEDARIEVTITRTSKGFDRLCAGEIDIVNASRLIDEDEAEACAEEDVDYIELHVANDALAIAMYRPILYEWVSCLTVEELRRIWGPDSTISNWRQVDPSFPEVPLRLYGPSAETGRFNFFTFVINGERGASRADYSATDDDNDTIEGIADDKGALGYFRFTYYQEHRERLRALAVDGGRGCVFPSVKTVQDGTYRPLSRPLFIYANRRSLESKPRVREFVRFTVRNAPRLARNVRFVPLSRAQLAQQLRRLDRVIG